MPETFHEAKYLFSMITELGMVDDPDSRLAQFLNIMQGAKDNFMPDNDFEYILCEDYRRYRRRTRCNDFLLHLREEIKDYRGTFSPNAQGNNLALVGETGGLLYYGTYLS